MRRFDGHGEPCQHAMGVELRIAGIRVADRTYLSKIEQDQRFLRHFRATGGFSWVARERKSSNLDAGRLN